jgi:hypothetical protein
MTEEQASPGIEFLIAEYQEIAQDFRRKREEGPQRLNFLITLTTSFAGGILVISELGSISTMTLQLVALGALCFLAIIAWETFDFTISRDVATDYNVRAMARIRIYFVERNPDFKNHLSWQTHDDPSYWITVNQSNTRTTTQTIFSLLCGAFLAIALNLIFDNLIVSAIIGLIFTAIVWALLLRYSNKRLAKAHESALRQTRFPEKQEETHEVNTNATEPQKDNKTNED